MPLYLEHSYKQGLHDGRLGGPMQWGYAHSTNTHPADRQAYRDGYAEGQKILKGESGAREPDDQTRSSEMLEQKIDELKASIDTLNETLRAGMAQAAAAAGGDAPSKPAKPAKAATKAKEEPAVKAEEPAAPVCTYAELRTEMLKVSAKKGDPALVALLGEFGAKTGKDIKEADYAKVLDRVAEILAEGESGGDDLL